MKAFSIAILIPAVALAQSVPEIVARGEKIFNQTCATGYCHGAKGEPAGAPRLAARGFDQAYISSTITRGVPGTAMPPFGTSMKPADLTAVAVYVASLNGIANPVVTVASNPPPPPALSPAAARGRELFSDSVRSFARCSTCHEVGGIGIPVATPMAAVPSSVAGLRALATPHVRTAVVNGETMPALVIGEAKRRTLFYDLTSLPPVLRTLDPADVKLTDGSLWKHSTAIASYSEAELSAILAYLKSVVR